MHAEISQRDLEMQKLVLPNPAAHNTNVNATLEKRNTFDTILKGPWAIFQTVNVTFCEKSLTAVGKVVFLLLTRVCLTSPAQRRLAV